MTNRFYLRPRDLLRRTAAFLVLAMLAVAGCDSSDPDDDGNDPPPPAAPNFSIASQTVLLNDGSDGIQFAATPSDDVVLVRVEIGDPFSAEYTFNAQSQTFLGGQPIDLGYAPKVSGNWSFRFTGRYAAGDQTSFDVTETLNVGARPGF